MTLSPAERQFLTELSKLDKHRCGFPQVRYAEALEKFGGLLDAGLIRERRYERNPGFQLTPAGRAFLDPMGDE